MSDVTKFGTTKFHSLGRSMSERLNEGNIKDHEVNFLLHSAEDIDEVSYGKMSSLPFPKEEMELEDIAFYVGLDYDYPRRECLFEQS